MPVLTEDNRKWWTLGAMCFALFMIMLDNTVVNVALPTIQLDLHASLKSLEWVLNAYTLTFAVLLVTAGRLGDIFGRRRGFLLGVTLFALSSATAGFAPTDTSLVISRAVQGIGAAFMMPATLSIITNAFPPRERGKAIGIWAGVSGAALAVGPVLGGFLTESVSWRWIFFINLPVAATAILVTLYATRESRDETVGRSVDFAGIAATTVSLTALVLALIEGNAWGWGSARVIGLFVLAVAGGVAFVLIERRVKTPMIDFSFFRSLTFLGANTVAFIVSFCMFAVFLFGALYLQNILHYSPLEAGVRFLPSTLLVIITAPIAGRLSDRIGSGPLMAVGMALLAGSLYIQSTIGVDSGYAHLLPAFMLMGVGIGMVMSPMSAAAMNSVAQEKAGVASGVLSMNRMVGASVGVAAVGAIFQSLSTTKLDELLQGTGLTAAQRSGLAAQVGEGGGGGARSKVPPDIARQVTDALHEAFIYAFTNAMKLSFAVALVGIVVALVLVRKRPAEAPVGAPAPQPRPQAPLEPEPVEAPVA